MRRFCLGMWCAVLIAGVGICGCTQSDTAGGKSADKTSSPDKVDSDKTSPPKMGGGSMHFGKIGSGKTESDKSGSEK